MLAEFVRHGRSVQIARSRKAGAYQLMTGQNPVYVFTMQAGGGV